MLVAAIQVIDSIHPRRTFCNQPREDQARARTQIRRHYRRTAETATMATNHGNL